MVARVTFSVLRARTLATARANIAELERQVATRVYQAQAELATNAARCVEEVARWWRMVTEQVATEERARSWEAARHAVLMRQLAVCNPNPTKRLRGLRV